MNFKKSWLASGMIVAAMFLVACGPKYPNCESDEHCKEKGEFCVDKLCRQCATSDNCKDKGPCSFCGASYTCDKPFGGPGDCCASDLDCKQGKCWMMPGAQKGSCAQCAANADCGPNMKCVQGSCVPDAECGADKPCPEGKVCNNGVCIAQSCNLDPVYFDFDEYSIRADGRDILNRNYECIQKKGQTIVVEGNCDDRGSDEYNLALGTRRADAAKKFLINLGMDKKQISSKSYGEERPTCTDQTESCWERNRRNEFRAQ